MKQTLCFRDLSFFLLWNSFCVQTKAYLLDDECLVSKNDFLMTCSYDFPNTSIIIPTILDEQKVIATYYDSGFTLYLYIVEGISYEVLPKTIKSIGSWLLSSGDASYIYKDRS